MDYSFVLLKMLYIKRLRRRLPPSQAQARTCFPAKSKPIFLRLAKLRKSKHTTAANTKSSAQRHVRPASHWKNQTCYTDMLSSHQTGQRQREPIRWLQRTSRKYGKSPLGVVLGAGPTRVFLRPIIQSNTGPTAQNSNLLHATTQSAPKQSADCEWYVRLPCGCHPEENTHNPGTRFPAKYASDAKIP